MKTDFTKTFFNRLNSALAESGITAIELCSNLNKKGLVTSERYLETCKRNNKIPELPILLAICAETSKDIHFFTGQENDNKNSSSDIIFPMTYSTFANVLPKQEFSNYIKDFDFSERSLKLSFYLNGKTSCENLYNSFFFTELLNKITLLESSSEFKGIDITVFYPKFYNAYDILSDKPLNNFNEETNNLLDECFDQFQGDYSYFRKKLFHKFDIKFISKITFTVNFIDIDDSILDTLECAILANDYAFFTSNSNYIITKTAYNSELLKNIKNDYEEKLTKSEQPDNQKQKKQLVKLLKELKDEKINRTQFIEELRNDNNKDIIQSLLRKTLLVSLPGLGKSTLIQKIHDMFFDINTPIEESDLYINYCIWDDNSDDTEISKYDVKGKYKETREEFKTKGDNDRRYLQIREHTVISTIIKASGNKGLVDLGAKELSYDNILFKALDEKFSIFHIVYSDTESPNNNDYYKKLYYQYLKDDKFRDEKIIDEKKRHNLHKAAKNDKGEIETESTAFENFINDLFEKRFKNYQKRSHYTIYRLKTDSVEDVVFKIIYQLLINM